MKKLEALLELGGIKKDVTLLALSGVRLARSTRLGRRSFCAVCRSCWKRSSDS